MSTTDQPLPVLLAQERSGPDAAGSPVVLLHGLTGSRESYAPIIEHLVAGGRSVVSADLRGHGASPRASSYRTVDYVADVVALIEGLDRGPAVVVGHSLGGLTAHALAQRRPELVAGLFLEDPPLYEGDAERRAASPAAALFPALIELISELQEAGASAEAVAVRVAEFPSPYGGTNADRLDGERILRRARSLLSTDVAAVQAAVSGEVWAGYDPGLVVDCPLTVLRADPAVGAVFRPEDAALLASICTQVEVVPISGIGHAIHGDPEGEAPYLRQLDRFLAGVG